MENYCKTSRPNQIATTTGSFVKNPWSKKVAVTRHGIFAIAHLDMIGLRKLSWADGWLFQFFFVDKHEKGTLRLGDFCIQKLKKKWTTKSIC